MTDDSTKNKSVCVHSRSLRARMPALDECLRIPTLRVPTPPPLTRLLQLKPLPLSADSGASLHYLLAHALISSLSVMLAPIYSWNLIEVLESGIMHHGPAEAADPLGLMKL